MQPRPAAPPPSVRFYRSKRNNAGVILTLVAAVFTFSTWMWPIAVPQGRGSLGVAWGIGALVVTAAYVAGFFLADKRWRRARTVIVLAAILHILGGLVSGLLADANELAPAVPAALFDIAPAVMALVGGLLIGPPPSPTRGDAPER
jgi:hypothetical protein